MKFCKPDYKTNQTKPFISYFSQNLKYTAESSWGKFEIQFEGSGGRSKNQVLEPLTSKTDKSIWYNIKLEILEVAAFTVSIVQERKYLGINTDLCRYKFSFTHAILDYDSVWTKTCFKCL